MKSALKFSVSIDSKTKYLKDLRRFVSEIANQIPRQRRPSDLVMRCTVALTEAVTNSIFHARRPQHPPRPIEVNYQLTEDRVRMNVIDEGPGFKLAPARLPRLGSARGRGLYLIRSLMDEVAVTRKNGKTIMSMACRLKKPVEASASGAAILKVVHRLSEAIASSSTVEQVCDAILKEATAIIPVAKASIMRYDPASKTLTIMASKGMPANVRANVRIAIGSGISGRVFATKSPLLVKDIRLAKEASGRRRYRSRSFMAVPVTCFPLKMQGLPVGVINMTDKKDGNPFTESDLKLLTTIANQTAAYLHLCDLADRARVAERLEKELEIARQIQRQFLPTGTAKIPGVDAAGCCWMAEKVGGDYYDVLVRGLAPLSAVVADVAGHSIGAALLMASLRGLLRMESVASYLTPSLMLKRINTLLYDDLASSAQFISSVCLQYNRGTSTLRYCVAGHHPPLIYQSRSDHFLPAPDDYGPPLGVDRSATYADERLTAEPGDMIGLITDGLFAVRNRKGEAFSLTRLKKFLRAQAKSPAKTIISRLHAELRAFSGGHAWPDDVTVVILKIK